MSSALHPFRYIVALSLAPYVEMRHLEQLLEQPVPDVLPRSSPLPPSYQGPVSLSRPPAHLHRRTGYLGRR